MTSEDDVKTAVTMAREKFGELNAAINCAGIGIAVLTYNHNKDRAHDLKEFERVIRASIYSKDRLIRTKNTRRLLSELNGCPNYQHNFSIKRVVKV